MEHAKITPLWQRTVDHLTWGHTYAIIAELEKKKLEKVNILELIQYTKQSIEILINMRDDEFTENK